MTKKTKKTESKASEPEVQTFESEDYTRERPQRRKTYERKKESEIPKYITELFAKDNYDLRFVRWQIAGEIDHRYLHRRRHEDGFEFVRPNELPKEYVQSMRILETDVTNGLVTNGSDLCLMKVDRDFNRSRKEFYDSVADAETAAVDVNVLNKKGFITKGSKSQTTLTEPKFQN